MEWTIDIDVDNCDDNDSLHSIIVWNKNHFIDFGIFEISYQDFHYK